MPAGHRRRPRHRDHVFMEHGERAAAAKRTSWRRSGSARTTSRHSIRQPASRQTRGCSATRSPTSPTATASGRPSSSAAPGRVVFMTLTTRGPSAPCPATRDPAAGDLYRRVPRQGGHVRRRRLPALAPLRRHRRSRRSTRSSAISSRLPAAGRRSSGWRQAPRRRLRRAGHAGRPRGRGVARGRRRRARPRLVHLRLAGRQRAELRVADDVAASMARRTRDSSRSRRCCSRRAVPWPPRARRAGQARRAGATPAATYVIAVNSYDLPVRWWRPGSRAPGTSA